MSTIPMPQQPGQPSAQPPSAEKLCCRCKATTNPDDGAVALTDHGAPLMCRPCYDRALRGFEMTEAKA